MERKQYLEYRPKLLIEPPILYYAIFCFVRILVTIITWTSCYLFYNIYLGSESGINIYILLIIIGVIFAFYEVYKISHERVLIHDNGKLELFFGKYFHKVVFIANIRQISFKRPWNIYGVNFIVLVLEMQNGQKIKFQVKEPKEFLAELKKHNPNIIVPELPEI